jgi:hypothetical protein
MSLVVAARKILKLLFVLTGSGKHLKEIHCDAPFKLYIDSVAIRTSRCHPIAEDMEQRGNNSTVGYPAKFFKFRRDRRTSAATSISEALRKRRSG